MEPMVLFGIQFTLSLLAYLLIAFWYVAPRLSRLPREVALVPLLWVHAFRVVGGTILAPGAVGSGVPTEFRTMIGYGDLITACLALLALTALRIRVQGAIALVWLFLIVGPRDGGGVAGLGRRVRATARQPPAIRWLGPAHRRGRLPAGMARAGGGLGPHRAGSAPV